MKRQFGRYEIQEEIGKGGMATVYAAHDPMFNRVVAIKILPSELLHDPTFRTRFEREARTIAALEHPAILPVYDFGEVDEQPFLVMRLMSGGSLADRIAQGPLDFQEAVRVVTAIASALDEAHSQGVVHRDLKPGNILFDQNNEPYLADFGIAKLSESGATLTGNAIVGTPAYMSPEQGRGEKDIDGRSDIYSLGIILYEMLTNELPYTADTPMAQLIKHITTPIPDILELRSDLPPDIQFALNRALSKRKFTRYSRAGEFAEALKAVLEGKSLPKSDVMPTMAELPGQADSQTDRVGARLTPQTPLPVIARPSQTPRPGEKRHTPAFAKISPSAQPKKRKRIGWVIGFLLFIVVLGGATVVVTQNPALLDTILGENNIFRVAVQPTLSPTAVIQPTSTSEIIEPTYTLTVVALKPTTTLPIATNTLEVTLEASTAMPEATATQVVDNPTVRYLPYDSSNYPRPSSDLTAAQLGDLIKLQASGTAAFYDIDWSPDSSALALASSTGVYIYDPKEINLPIKWLSAQGWVGTVNFSPDGIHLITAEMDRLVIWDWQEATQTLIIPNEGEYADFAAFSADGNKIAAGNAYNTKIYNVSDGSLLLYLPGVPAASVSFSSDGNLLSAPVEKESAQILDLATGKVVAEFRLYDIHQAVFVPESDNFIGVANSTAHMWNIETKQLVDSLGGINPVISKNGKFIAIDNQNATIQIWRITNEGFGSEPIRKYDYGSRYRATFQLSWNGSVLVYGYELDLNYGQTFTPSRLYTFDIVENVPLREVGIKGEYVKEPLFEAIFSPDGTLLASLANYRHVETMQIALGSQLHNLHSQILSLRGGSTGFSINSADFGPRSKEVLSMDGKLRAKAVESQVMVAEAQDNTLLSTINANAITDTDITFSPNGEVIATISTGGTIRLWNVKTTRQVCVIGGVGAVATIQDADKLFFSQDGNLLAIYHTNSKLSYWDAGNCQPITTYNLTPQSYSKDLSFFVEIGEEGLVLRAFDNAEQITIIYGKYLDVSFSENGKLMAAHMWDGTLHIWGLDPSK